MRVVACPSELLRLYSALWHSHDLVCAGQATLQILFELEALRSPAVLASARRRRHVCAAEDYDGICALKRCGAPESGLCNSNEVMRLIGCLTAGQRIAAGRTAAGIHCSRARSVAVYVHGHQHSVRRGMRCSLVVHSDAIRQSASAMCRPGIQRGDQWSLTIRMIPTVGPLQAE